MFSTELCLSGIELTVEVLGRTSSQLATIVSHALQPQDGRIPCPVHRNLATLIFCLFLDNVEIIVNIICF